MSKKRATGNFRESPLYEERFGVVAGQGALWALTAVLLILCFVVLPFALYSSVTFARVFVEGNSMNDALSDGDTLFVDYRHEASRGDIVVVNISAYREEYAFTGNYIIKRLIATEGDSVYCKNNQVYIRYAGEETFIPLEEDYLSDTAYTANFSVVTVGEGEIFVMGDNRANSYDSRRTGCFKTEDIFGFVPSWSYALKGVFTWFNNTFGARALSWQGAQIQESKIFYSHKEIELCTQ